MLIFIIIPAYNEEKTIGDVIVSLLEAGYQNIVVVNDGSTDKTAQAVESYPVYLINHIVNLGQGAALRTGTDFVLEKGADIIVHFDADGQHQAKDIEKLVAAINSGYDLGLGSRFLGGRQSIPWSKKYFILKPGIIFNWIFTGLKLTDAHNGFRALSRLAAQKIKITQNSMAHSTEIPAEIKKHNLNFMEVPVDILYQNYGQGLSGGVKIIFDLLKKNFL